MDAVLVVVNGQHSQGTEEVLTQAGICDQMARQVANRVRVLTQLSYGVVTRTVALRLRRQSLRWTS